MLFLSHRGDHQSHPENTLEAFAAALALGVDGIETDVRLSADGLPILFHDRLAPSGNPVAELTRAELATETGHAIPTLDEALAAWREPLWNVEVKTPAAVPAAIDVLRRFAHTHRLLVTSFCHPILAPIADALGIECGALCAHAPADPAVFLRSLRGLHPRLTTTVWPFELLSAELVVAARTEELRVFVYNVHTPADLVRCHAFAVDAVILDRPELAESD